MREVLPYFPPAVHLVVVDPGVGTDRNAIVLTAGEHYLVGPDNGVMMPAAQVMGDGLQPGSIPIPRRFTVATCLHPLPPPSTIVAREALNTFNADRTWSGSPSQYRDAKETIFTEKSSWSTRSGT